MINVSVRYFNILSSYATKKGEQLRVAKATTVRDLIHKLVKINPPQFADAVLMEGEIREHLRIFRNDHPLDGDQLDEPIEDGDHFMLFPAVAGG